MYKVVFNNDENNYELFETLEDAKRFASRYGGVFVVFVGGEKWLEK